MSAQQYPLQWPMGWKRTQNPLDARFKLGLHQAMRHLLSELDLLGAINVVVSSNLQVRRDGMPLADQREPKDSGVAVYFQLNGQDQCIPCDKWYYVRDNIRAVGLTVEALRGLERWGAKEMVNAAFRGFKALPETIIMGEHTARAWWEVLQVSQTADWDVIDAAYK